MASEAVVTDLQDYLRLLTQPPFSNLRAAFILEHGRGFRITEDSFRHPSGEPRQCYRNAGLLALERPELTYVEGYLSWDGLPLEHAWVVDADGNVIDPTLALHEEKRWSVYRQFWGVPFKTDFLRETILRSKVWGLFHWRNQGIYSLDPSRFRQE